MNKIYFQQTKNKFYMSNILNKIYKRKKNQLYRILDKHIQQKKIFPESLIFHFTFQICY